MELRKLPDISCSFALAEIISLRP